MFDEAIDFNQYKLQRIVDKYMKYKPFFSCVRNKNGPMPLCKNYYYILIIQFLAIIPYYGLFIVFFAGMLWALMVFGWELLKRTKLRKDM